MRRRRNVHGMEKGANLIEFTLVGIPIIFILISVFEVSRGMWLYQTAAHASREGARYIVVHGANCKNDSALCGRSISEIATELNTHLVGLNPSDVQVTFRAGCSGANAFRACASQSGTLQSFLNDVTTTHWPGAAGANDSLLFAEVEIEFPFRSAIAMFWPGAGRGTTFGSVQMFAGSKEMFQF